MDACSGKQHQALRSFMVVILDGSHLRRNHMDLLPTMETTPVISPATEPAASDEPRTPMPLNREAGIEKRMAELQPRQSGQPLFRQLINP